MNSLNVIELNMYLDFAVTFDERRDSPSDEDIDKLNPSLWFGLLLAT